jgi:hypothetical protein
VGMWGNKSGLSLSQSRMVASADAAAVQRTFCEWLLSI